MTNRQGFPLYGKRFCGNTNKMEVHDLDNEKRVCQIEEIIDANPTQTFIPDTLEEAYKEGYDNCQYCIGGSLR